MGSPVSPKALNIVCSPRQHAPLRIVSEPSLNGEPAEFLCNGEHGLKFPIRGSVPVFVEPGQITGINVRIRGIYDRWARVPGISAWFRHPRRPIVPPTALVPAGMEEMEFRELYDGKAWYLSFRTPR
jgi:uncharacterized protein YbaR (Trm112 family)